MSLTIHFNKPFYSRKGTFFIHDALSRGHISGNGYYTRKCREFLENEWHFNEVLLTTSCTDALEMSAMLAGIRDGDEVIVPAFTFVSTALAFARQGARIVFIDSKPGNPCLDEKKLEKLITGKTRAIVPVHYAGIPCNMDRILEVAGKYNLLVIEDAAHAFGSRYKGKLAGTIGHLGCFSFHETKIIHCGEGGMLAVNDERFKDRARIIWEKGTNRYDFIKGKVKEYEWLDTGSSFLMSDMNAAFLYGQFLFSKQILERREKQWKLYYRKLKAIEKRKLIKLPVVEKDNVPNYSSFFLMTRTPKERQKLLSFLNESGVHALTHYLDLSRSPYVLKHQPEKVSHQRNTNSLKFQGTILRLPLYHDLKMKQIDGISDMIETFYSDAGNFSR